ncbi:nickel insertion protein [Brevibacillus fluminis]|uniref:nickel insertion protein n=1 Tax=Brevibacillus fluminis TaxID=511487 RepID=UPI003F888DEE
MKLYLKSDRPLTLAALAGLCRELAAGIVPMTATVPVWTDKQREAWIEQILQVAAPYADQAPDDWWQEEIDALRELAQSPFVTMEWMVAPLIVPRQFPVSQYALLTGFAIREELSADKWLSPLALLYLKSIGASSMPQQPVKVEQVALNEGAALLLVDCVEQAQIHQREMRQHGEEHIDEGMMLLQANLDDCTPEWLAYCMERLFAAGANDVSVIPLTMKKGRQGSMLQVLCYQSQLDALKTILFEETTTFGIRYFPAAVHRLGRRVVTVKTRFGEVEVKLGYHHGKRVQSSPEYEACAKRAREAGVPLGTVYTEAIRLAETLEDD